MVQVMPEKNAESYAIHVFDLTTSLGKRFFI